MNMLVNPIHFHSNKDKENVLLALSNPCCRQILLSTIKKAKTVDQISNELPFSKSSIYRKLHQLENSKLVIVSGIFSKEGNKIFQYQSRIYRIESICFDDGFTFKIILNEVYSDGT